MKSYIFGVDLQEFIYNQCKQDIMEAVWTQVLYNTTKQVQQPCYLENQQS